MITKHLNTITKRLNATWRIDRPFRAFARSSAALSLFVGASIPCMGDHPNWWLWLPTVFGYSALLSFFSVGVCLLPARVRGRAFVAMLTLPFLCTAFNLTLLILAWSRALTVISSILSPAIWTLSVIGVALLALAFYGWYFRLIQDAPEAV